MEKKRNYVYRSAAILFTLFVLLFVTAIPAAAKTHSTTYKGIDYKRVYDYTYYTTKKHSELAGESDKTVLKYFVTEGIPAGEQAIASFSVKSYRNANQDLRKSYGKDYAKYIAHYIKKGYRQKRTVLGYDKKIKDPVTIYKGQNYDKVYDFDYYIKKYYKIRKKYKLDDFGALEYFVTKGMKKKHQAIATFNVMWYYYSNDNMRWMCGQDWSRYYIYYQKKGYRKAGKLKPLTKIKNPITYYKRSGTRMDLSSIYNFAYYTKHNSAAYKYWKNQDDAGAIRHFISYGMLLNYKAKKGVSVSSSKYTSIRKKLYPNLNTNAYFKANSYSSRTRYLMLINQGEHMVYVFEGKQGEWQCIRSFACCIGKPSTPTPQGVYSLGGKVIYFDSNNCRCWYASQITGSILFHSILYYQESAPAHVLDGTLGASVSHGCVRLATSNAKWVYDTIPAGTTVVSYNRPF